MRKSGLAGLAITMTAAAVVVLGPAGSAFAAGSSNCGAPSTGYPPTAGSKAQIQVSTTIPNPGESIEVSGSHYIGNENVKIYIGGSVTACEPGTLTGATFVGTGHTNSAGVFDPSVVVPSSLSGTQIVTGIGASGKSYDFDTQVITVGGAAPSSATTTPSQPPAVTGTDIGLMAAVAAVLLGAGAVFTRGGRRRRAAAHH